MEKKLDWKAQYIYWFMIHNKDKRYETAEEFYNELGMTKRVARRIINELVEQKMVIWQARNPDGKLYILL